MEAIQHNMVVAVPHAFSESDYELCLSYTCICWTCILINNHSIHECPFIFYVDITSLNLNNSTMLKWFMLGKMLIDLLQS